MKVQRVSWKILIPGHCYYDKTTNDAKMPPKLLVHPPSEKVVESKKKLFLVKLAWTPYGEGAMSLCVQTDISHCCYTLRTSIILMKAI